MQRNRGKLIKCFINVCFVGWCLTKNPESKPNCQVLSINIIENLRYSFQIPLELSKDALMKPANGVKLKLEKKDNWLGGNCYDEDSIWLYTFLLEQMFKDNIMKWQKCNIKTVYDYIFSFRWFVVEIKRTLKISLWNGSEIRTCLIWFLFKRHQVTRIKFLVRQTPRARIIIKLCKWYYH